MSGLLKYARLLLPAMGVCLDVCNRCSHPMTYMYHDHDYLYKQTDGVIDSINLISKVHYMLYSATIYNT